MVICYIRAVNTSAQRGKTPSAAAYRITFLMSRETLPSVFATGAVTARISGESHSSPQQENTSSAASKTAHTLE